MRKIIYLLLFVIVALNAGILVMAEREYQDQRHCTGYTVIDYDRVVDCYGDTVEYNWHQEYGN